MYMYIYMYVMCMYIYIYIYIYMYTGAAKKRCASRLHLRCMRPSCPRLPLRLSRLLVSCSCRVLLAEDSVHMAVSCREAPGGFHDPPPRANEGGMALGRRGC